MKVVMLIVSVMVALVVVGFLYDGDGSSLDSKEVQVTKMLLADQTVAFRDMPLHLRHGFIDEATAVRIGKATGRTTDEIFQLYRELGIVHNKPTTAPATLPAQ